MSTSMKVVIGENETAIYPLLSHSESATDDDFCIVVSNSFILINEKIVDEDDLTAIISGIEKAIEILDLR